MKNNEVTPAAILRTVRQAAALGEAIRELGAVPEGVLHANTMSALPLPEFKAVLRLLHAMSLIAIDNHVIRWIAVPLNNERFDRLVATVRD